MKIQILRPAMEDLTNGRMFYDRQAAGVGDYFFDSLFAEIDSLSLYAGIHALHFGFYRLLAKRFLLQTDRGARVLDCRRNPKRLYQAIKEAD